MNKETFLAELKRGLSGLPQFLGFGYAGLGHEQIDAQAGEENQHQGEEEEHALVDADDLAGYC